MNLDVLQLDHKTMDIIICHSCLGAGKIVTNTQRLEEDESMNEDCTRCGGTGRMIKRVSIEFERFTK